MMLLKQVSFHDILVTFSTSQNAHDKNKNQKKQATDRLWITAVLDDETKLSLFIKVPSHQLWLRSILLFTGLFKNELDFFTNAAKEVSKVIDIPKVMMTHFLFFLVFLFCFVFFFFLEEQN